MFCIKLTTSGTCALLSVEVITYTHVVQESTANDWQRNRSQETPNARYAKCFPIIHFMVILEKTVGDDRRTKYAQTQFRMEMFFLRSPLFRHSIHLVTFVADPWNLGMICKGRLDLLLEFDFRSIAALSAEQSAKNLWQAERDFSPGFGLTKNKTSLNGRWSS